MTESSQLFTCVDSLVAHELWSYPMTLTILEDTTDSLFLELSGSLNVAGTCEVETRFLAHATTGRPIVVDFSQVTFRGSFGLRMICEAIRALERNGKKLCHTDSTTFGSERSELGGIKEIAVIVHDPFRGAPQSSCQVLR
jgi:anti-anti-sigma factor